MNEKVKLNGFIKHTLSFILLKVKMFAKFYHSKYFSGKSKQKKWKLFYLCSKSNFETLKTPSYIYSVKQIKMSGIGLIQLLSKPLRFFIFL